MQAFANNVQHKASLLKNKDLLKFKIYQDVDALNRTDKDKNTYLFDGRYNNSKDVIKRIEYFEEFLRKIIESS